MKGEIKMTLKKNWSPKIGEKVITTEKLSNLSGTLPKGSTVTVIGVDQRGYDLQDEDGNKILECGWNCIKPA